MQTKEEDDTRPHLGLNDRPRLVSILPVLKRNTVIPPPGVGQMWAAHMVLVMAKAPNDLTIYWKCALNLIKNVNKSQKNNIFINNVIPFYIIVDI